MYVYVYMFVYVYVCVCKNTHVFFNPQEHFQLEDPLFKLNEIVILELAPGHMSVYKLISQSCGNS